MPSIIEKRCVKSPNELKDYQSYGFLLENPSYEKKITIKRHKVSGLKHSFANTPLLTSATNLRSVLTSTNQWCWQQAWLKLQNSKNHRVSYHHPLNQISTFQRQFFYTKLHLSQANQFQQYLLAPIAPQIFETTEHAKFL
jgi:hypothetical protein